MKIVISYIGFKISGGAVSLSESTYNKSEYLDYEKLKLSLNKYLNIKIGVRTGLLQKSSMKINIGELAKMKKEDVYFLKDSFDIDHYISHFGPNREIVIMVAEFK